MTGGQALAILIVIIIVYWITPPTKGYAREQRRKELRAATETRKSFKKWENRHK